MILPNKLFSYNESTLSKIPLILNALKKETTPKELLKSVQIPPLDFLDVLDCLYALNVIDINDEGRIYKC